MRSVELSNGRKIDVRPMTSQEVMDGRRYGFSLASWKGSWKGFDEACRYCISIQFKKDYFNDLPASDQYKTFKAILAETYPHIGEKKKPPKSSTVGYKKI